MAEGTTGPFVELTEKECHDRLAARTTGRVGWSAGGNQRILPVTYTVHAGKIVFRTSPYGSLSELIRPMAAAFEVDEIDEVSGDGWSVLVQGRAEGVVRVADLGDLWTTNELAPWAPGTRNVFVAITPHTISGRSLRAPFAR